MMKYFLLGLLILICPALCFKIKNVETTTAQLFLGNDGELTDTSGIPDCGSNKIILKSYAYDQMECTRVSCKSVHTEALSEATAFQLHRNCSFRHICENLKFPLPTSLRNNLNANASILRVAVTIQYQCLEEDKVVLNMCEENYLTFTDTLYLTLNDYTKDLTECQCWVNWGAFSLIIMDLRLNSRNQDTSSDNELLINKHHYKCNPQSESYGAIFGDIKMFNDVNPDAMISLKSTSSILKPEMVWIAVVPEGTSRLECLGGRPASPKSTRSVSTPKTRQSAWISQVTVTTSDTQKDDSSKADGETTIRMVVVIVSVFALVIIVFCLLYICVWGTMPRWALCFQRMCETRTLDNMRRWNYWFGTSPRYSQHL